METREVYRLGRYVIDLDRRHVSANGSTIELAWRHFEALRLLVEADGRVVEKEKFFQQIWNGQLVDESNLTQCIAQLRKALNNGGDVDYLETVPRLGYRLAVPAVPGPANMASPPPAAKPRVRLRGWVAAVVAVAGAALAWGAMARTERLSQAEVAYNEGRRIRNQKNRAVIGGAVSAFQRAINLNPNKAEYYGSLAEALTQAADLPGSDKKLMLEAARRSVALDPRCGGCNAVLGFILFSRFQEWSAAERHLKLALEVNPKDAGARGYLAMLLSSQGRLDEALREIDTGIKLDPYHSTLHTIRSGVLYFSKRYEDAGEAAGRAVSFGLSQPGAWNWRVYSLLSQGDHASAVSLMASSRLEYYSPELPILFRLKGMSGVARQVLAATEQSLPGAAYRRAHWRMLLGDRQGALTELEAAHQMNAFDLMYAAVDPMFEPLHNEPRFRKITSEMKLPVR